jgi:glucuronosyltransferase
MKLLVFGLLALSYGLPVSIEGAKILAFLPFPAKSHHAVFTPIIRGLLAKGHQVTHVTPMSLSDPSPNYKEILIPNILADLLGE